MIVVLSNIGKSTILILNLCEYSAFLYDSQTTAVNSLVAA